MRGRASPPELRGARAPVRCRLNLVVYVSDALRTDHLGCYGARFVNTQTIDELAAGGRALRPGDQRRSWTCPSMASMVTGLYPHHHGFLHWDASSTRPSPTLFRAAGADYEVGELRLRRGLPLQGASGRERARHEREAGRRGRVAAREPRTPFLLFFHSWATHMPYDVLHAERRSGARRSRR